MLTRNVCVVGAGVAGLTSIKHCLENGLDPVCYEKDNDIGGIWNYHEQPMDGCPSIYNSCSTNTSKEMTCFSDFPIPKEFPNFMGHKHFKEYLNLYATNFNLRQYINFDWQVQYIEKSTKGDVWNVRSRNLKTGETRTDIYSFVMVCQGHLYKPNIPYFTGLNRFKGKVLHTHDYKTFHGYEGQKILVVGMGNSGADVACELSRHANHVYISTRAGRYVKQRTADYGTPFDHLKLTRFNLSLPACLTSAILYYKLNYRYNHTKYGLAPSLKFSKCKQTISDDLANRIIYGTINVVSKIKEFTESGVILEDGLQIHDLDSVIFATGYQIEFSFLDKSVIEMDKRFLFLFKGVFPVDNALNNFAVIGSVAPIGPLPPVLEMQARVACSVFAGASLLPTPPIRRMIVEHSRHTLIKNHGDRGLRSQDLRISYISYMDDLAKMIGCKPNIKRYLVTNVKFAYKLYFGPATPAQWRLNGPYKWKGAAEAINNVERNTYYPMRTRRIREPNELLNTLTRVAVFLMFLMFYIHLYF